MTDSALPVEIASAMAARIAASVSRERLLQHAIRLIEIPSPTRSAAAVADCLEEILRAEGFDVDRPDAGWADAPAVVARWQPAGEGRTLQFNGHLDTVHLPFVPARVENDNLYGSGCSDMKGGIAAMLEAMLALRDADALRRGAILLTAHDLHETPWGDGSQVNGLISDGYVGDAVLLPEYLSDRLPVIGRGLSVLNIELSRDGDPVHEVLGGIDQPSVIRAGADLVQTLAELDRQLAQIHHPMAGRESYFVGQIEAGEIFNQAPTVCRLAGTRRWLPTTDAEDVRRQFHDVVSEVAARNGVRAEARFQMARDAFEIDESDSLVQSFQAAYTADAGAALPIGAKPFVDDGNAFVRQAGIPAITHGPNATGAHTLLEECPIAELERVARVYAMTAVAFC